MSGRYIPEDTKRKVRRKCHFGCIICGCPIFHYDHVVEYSKAGEHGVDNLVLLCGTHHDQKTRGQISSDVVRQYLTRPFNLGNDFTSKAVTGRFSGSEASIEAGDAIFTFPFDKDGVGVAISVEGLPALSLTKEDGFLLLGIRLYIPGVGVALEIARGEMVVTTGAWDYRYEGKVIRIWSDELQRTVRLSIDSQSNKVTMYEGHFAGRHCGVSVKNGRLRLHPSGPELINMHLIKGGIHMTPQGLRLG